MTCAVLHSGCLLPTCEALRQSKSSSSSYSPTIVSCDTLQQRSRSESWSQLQLHIDKLLPESRTLVQVLSCSLKVANNHNLGVTSGHSVIPEDKWIPCLPRGIDASSLRQVWNGGRVKGNGSDQATAGLSYTSLEVKKAG